MSDKYSRREFLRGAAATAGAAGVAGCLGDDEDAEEGPFAGERKRLGGGKETDVVINEDDFFERRFELPEPGWVQYKIEVNDSYKENPDIGEPVRVEGLVMTEEEFNQYFQNYDKTEYLDDLTEGGISEESGEVTEAGKIREPDEYVLAVDNSIRGPTNPIDNNGINNWANVDIEWDYGVYE